MKKILMIATLAIGLISSVFASKVVKYSDFGAKGDGKTDDMQAIKDAHDYANKNNLPVVADDNATYYIGGKDITAIIQTDTDFGNAKFIIDDRKIENIKQYIFIIQSKMAPINLKETKKIKTLTKGQSTLDIDLGYDAVVYAQNNKKRQYIRVGLNAGSGNLQKDVFFVDKDNNIDPNNPILWDFDYLTTLKAFPIDKELLTVKGGEFTTIANNMAGTYQYHQRGFQINRSNLLVENVKHYIKGEGEVGQPYYGFMITENCANVTIKDCLFTSHKTYITKNKSGNPVQMGTYDFNISYALNVTLENCTQINDINDKTYWGIMASNYAKNLTYKNCKLSRYDSHRGVFNGAIIDSVIGASGGINLIGSGTFLLENSTVHNYTLINLRRDYGSTWEGDIIIKNVVYSPKNITAVPNIINMENFGQHDFGYTCYMPKKLIIDGLKIDNPTSKTPLGAKLFSNFNPDYVDESYQQSSPYISDIEIDIKNLTLTGGKKIIVSDNKFLADKYKNALKK